ncbi:alpha/beta fold hydrolase [Candidatus Riflebacteria bacterium]
MSKEDKTDMYKVEKEFKKFFSYLFSKKKLKDYREKIREQMSPCPRELVYREHSTSLYYYPGERKSQGKTPLLIIPSLVNKPCIMDLLPGESFIEAMLKRGLAVYMFEWGEPTPGQKDFSLEYYLTHYIGRAVRRVLNHSGSKKVNLGGYCLGGGLALLYTALDERKEVEKLITMVTPVNFEDRGLLSWWSKKQHFNVDKIVDSLGNIPGDFFAMSFPWLVPTAQLKKMRILYENHENPEALKSFMAIDIWLSENIGFPGEVYREIIKKGFQENTLIKNKAWVMQNRVAALKNIDIPVLNLCASYDHVSPVESCNILSELLSNAACESRTYPVGHLGIALGHGAPDGSLQIWDEISSWVVGK